MQVKWFYNCSFEIVTNMLSLCHLSDYYLWILLNFTRTHLHLSLNHYASLSYLIVWKLMGVLPCKLIHYYNDVGPE